MPSLRNHHSHSLVKLLAIGDAKSGKTGSLTSLVKAGYKLRILDFDNLLDILSVCVQAECPDMIDNVEFRALRDKRKNGPEGWTIDGIAKAFTESMKMLDNWRYTDGDGEVSLGKPSDWGPDCILVIDSLSRLCDAAYDWQVSIATGKVDGRAVYGNAQDAVENVLAGLTSPNFQTNVIVIAHVSLYTQPDGTMKGFPQGVGQKLSPKIPQYFPNVVLYQTSNSGKRTIKTTSTPFIDLANIKPFKVEKEYPIETGLAEFFRVLADPPTKGVTRVAESVPEPTAQVTTPNFRKTP